LFDLESKYRLLAVDVVLLESSVRIVKKHDLVLPFVLGKFMDDPGY